VFHASHIWFPFNNLGHFMLIIWNLFTRSGIIKSRPSSNYLKFIYQLIDHQRFGGISPRKCLIITCKILHSEYVLNVWDVQILCQKSVLEEREFTTLNDHKLNNTEINQIFSKLVKAFSWDMFAFSIKMFSSFMWHRIPYYFHGCQLSI
jgi:hypothetical protein